MKKIRGIKTLFSIAAALTAMTPVQAIAHLLQEHEFAHRGHGGNHRASGSRTKVYATMRAQRNKYQPHQGKREIARRALPMSMRAPMAASEDVGRPVKPHRSGGGYWVGGAA